jgi:nicotinate-nucleotide pyrophosphorylase (carboxylating)
MKPALAQVRADVARALEEDLGAIDLTAQLLPAWAEGRACIITREAAVLCGRDWAEAAFRALDADAHIDWTASDGDRVQAGQALCEISAKVRAIVSAERTALNFLQTLSGTATTARSYADAIMGARTRILDTRKTLPGLRAAQKYAVHCGGAVNHRAGLYDAVLIKENHIRAAGSIAAAIAAARAIACGRMVEIEVENLTEFATALAAKPDRIMLDELGMDDMRRAVSLNDGQVELEISGGVSIERLPELAAIGVDYISVGALTKHVRAVDLSLRMIA